MTKEIVAKWLSKMPLSERDLPLLILNGTAYSPNQIDNEVRRGTPAGQQLQQMIEAGKLTLESGSNGNGGNGIQSELVMVRLQQFLSQKDPTRVIYATLQGIGVKTYTAAQLLKEIQNNTPVGQQWINNETKHMQNVLKVS